MKRLYDRKAEVRQFSPGDQVLALLPVVSSPFQAKFLGPFTVLRKLSDLNYLIETPGRRRKTQVCHVNLLKPYFSRGAHSSVAGGSVQPSASPALMADTVRGYLSGDVVVLDDDDGVVAPDECRLRGWLKNPETLSNLESVCEHFSPERSAELSALIRGYLCLFNDVIS